MTFLIVTDIAVLAVPTAVGCAVWLASCALILLIQILIPVALYKALRVFRAVHTLITAAATVRIPIWVVWHQRVLALAETDFVDKPSEELAILRLAV